MVNFFYPSFISLPEVHLYYCSIISLLLKIKGVLCSTKWFMLSRHCVAFAKHIVGTQILQHKKNVYNICLLLYIASSFSTSSKKYIFQPQSYIIFLFVSVHLPLTKIQRYCCRQDNKYKKLLPALDILVFNINLYMP